MGMKARKKPSQSALAVTARGGWEVIRGRRKGRSDDALAIAVCSDYEDFSPKDKITAMFFAFSVGYIIGVAESSKRIAASVLMEYRD